MSSDDSRISTEELLALAEPVHVDTLTRWESDPYAGRHILDSCRLQLEMPRRCVNSPRRVRILQKGPDVTKATCSIDGCERPVRGRGWCASHHARWRRGVDPALGGPIAARQAPVCSIDSCDRKTVARGWCQPHWYRWSKHGAPDQGTPIKKARGNRTSCLVDGCRTPLHGSTYCSAHYKRWRMYGDPLGNATPKPKRLCQLEGCDEVHYGKGYCYLHFFRWRTHGDPYAKVKPVTPAGAPAAFIQKAVNWQSDECLPWPFKQNEAGYGYINVVIDGKQMGTTAHRWALWQAVGPPPAPNYTAAHKPVECHNPNCINPRHLRWATLSSNHRDKVLDGTHDRGEQNPMSKLTTPEVLDIRDDPRPVDVIALDYGVSDSCIRAVQNRKSWAWLPEREAADG